MSEYNVYKKNRNAYLNHYQFSVAASRKACKVALFARSLYGELDMYAGLEDGYESIFSIHDGRLESQSPNVEFNSIDDVLYSIHRAVALTCWGIKLQWEMNQKEQCDPTQALGFGTDWRAFDRHLIELIWEVFGRPRMIRYVNTCEKCIPLMMDGMFDVFVCVRGNHISVGTVELILRYGNEEGQAKYATLSPSRVEQLTTSDGRFTSDRAYLRNVLSRAAFYVVNNAESFLFRDDYMKRRYERQVAFVRAWMEEKRELNAARKRMAREIQATHYTATNLRTDMYRGINNA